LLIVGGTGVGGNAVTFDQVQELIKPLVVGQTAIIEGQKTAERIRLKRELCCWRTNNRTQVESTEFKLAVIAYYGREVARVGDHITTARCMVTNDVYDYKDLRPAHLVKLATPELMTAYGLDPEGVDDPRNAILMLDAIAKAIDRLNVCFLYNSMANQISLKVLKPEIRVSRISSSPTDIRTFDAIDGTIISHPADCYPYRRILSMHAKFAYSRALKYGWIPNTAVLNTYFDVSDAGLEEPEYTRLLT